MMENEVNENELDNQENQKTNMGSDYINFPGENLNHKVYSDVDSFAKNDNKIEHEDLGKAGAIINIIGAILLLIIFLWSIFLIPLIVFSVWAIISNSNYLGGKNNKISAGVTGLLFSCILGGIFVLVSK